MLFKKRWWKRSDLAEKPNGDFTNMTNIMFDDILINFGYSSKEEKKRILKENPDKDIYMDLTCYNPAEFYAEFSNLKGCFAALFCDEEKKIEVHQIKKSQAFLDKLRAFGFIPFEITLISCGFIFPRTIVQIINEAHFALEEEVASASDIDRAMKFGVNYPKGPFEWGRGREIYVVALLNELFHLTGDKRYLPAKNLFK
jgi:hypothetical protein